MVEAVCLQRAIISLAEGDDGWPKSLLEISIRKRWST
jgi:hypothetical protein